MIGLMFLAVTCLWLAIAVFLCIRLPNWLGIKRHTIPASILLLPILLAAPFADELIGRWQFNRLCGREAVVTLSPDWEKDKRARDNDDAITEIDGYVIPIRAQRDEFVDANTKQPFLTCPHLRVFAQQLFSLPFNESQ